MIKNTFSGTIGNVALPRTEAEPSGMEDLYPRNAEYAGDTYEALDPNEQMELTGLGNLPGNYFTQDPYSAFKGTGEGLESLGLSEEVNEGLSMLGLTQSQPQIKKMPNWVIIAGLALLFFVVIK